ncbi:pentatricopeptide repeat-containing protein At4g01990, mitochondrial-like [Silene latifolia]|uniref:pentatricopeptide repeat-containing protein At4g01990, mitochondrial-like n=1 Tax=Silene latifolia TaxID=37657 RepID=UPI003D77B6A8
MHQALKLTKMKVSTTIATRLNTNLHSLLRHISTTATTATTAAATTTKAASKEHIMKQIYKVGSAGGKVSDVLDHITKTGQRVTTFTLFNCLKDLRRNGSYQQCLEIIDWFQKDGNDISDRNFTMRIDILHKFKGLAEVEKYFDSIPSVSKNSYVYGSLLSCYCADLETDKALATFKKMDEMGFASHVVVFNNILNLYVKTKQPEKVPELISEMKKRHLALNSHTYCFWIQSCRLLGDLEGVERVFHEALEDKLIEDDWLIYCNVASVFIEFGQFEKASSYLKKLENVLNCSDNPSRDAFYRLISLYAGAGKLDAVIQSWNTLKSKYKVINKQSYLTLLQALSRLDDIKALEKYFREWESTSKNYDDIVPSVLIGAYLRHGMLKEADLLLKDATKKKGSVPRFPHVEFMNYYFEKGQTECALKHMEAAIDSKWKPLAEKLDPCFQHFKDRKDVDGLEKFCRLLKRSQALDAKAYLWVLETYVDAEKTAPDMRERIKADGINVTPRLEELLKRVCPNWF